MGGVMALRRLVPGGDPVPVNPVKEGSGNGG